LSRHFVKVTPFHALKTCRGSSYIAAVIVNISTAWKWAVNFPPWLLYTQESALVPIALEAWWVPEPIWRRENSLAATMMKPIPSSS